MSETDGIEEAFEGQLRVMLTAAGQVGERLARAREEQQRRAQAFSEQETRELASRIDAQRRTAVAELGIVYRPQWWADASPKQISEAYQMARAWAGEEPDAARAAQHVLEEVRSRYGVDLAGGLDRGADPTVVREAIARAERLQASVTAAGRSAVAEHIDTALLMTQADAADRAAERSRDAGRAGADRTSADRAGKGGTSAGGTRPAYDSPQRRDSTAAALVEVAGIDPETVATRMRADVSQGRPAAAATSPTAAPAPPARRARGVSTEIHRTSPAR